jgi:hypothetical protein
VNRPIPNEKNRRRCQFIWIWEIRRSRTPDRAWDACAILRVCMSEFPRPFGYLAIHLRPTDDNTRREQFVEGLASIMMISFRRTSAIAPGVHNPEIPGRSACPVCSIEGEGARILLAH